MMKGSRSIPSLMAMTHRNRLQQHIHCRSSASRSLWSKQPHPVSRAGIDKILSTTPKSTNISSCNDTILYLKNGRTAYMTTSTTTTTIATANSTSASSAHSSSSFKIFQYALGGWIFFIAENFVLSENRQLIIEYLNGATDHKSHDDDDDDDDESKYRMVYGTFSTIATLSILYGYRQLRNMRQLGMQLNPHVTGPTTMLVSTMAITMISFGLVLVSQAFPKLQIPIEFSASSTTTPATATVESTTATTSNGNSPSTGTGFAFKVRCPFDFSDSKRSSTTDAASADFVRGMDRITRHSGLWSFGFIGLGNAFLQPTLGLTLFMTGPVLVALVGGYHYDSRLQRNMGGSFPSKQYEQQTSNIPFLAMILGQQEEGNFMNSLSTLVTQELKFLNAAVAVMIGTLYVVLNKGRHVSYICQILMYSSPQKVTTASKLKYR